VREPFWNAQLLLCAQFAFAVLKIRQDPMNPTVGTHHEDPNMTAPHHEGPNMNAPHHEGPNMNAPHHEGPNMTPHHHEGPNMNGPHHEGHNMNGPHHEGPNMNGPHHEGPNMNSSHHGIHSHHHFRGNKTSEEELHEHLIMKELMRHKHALRREHHSHFDAKNHMGPYPTGSNYAPESSHHGIHQEGQHMFSSHQFNGPSDLAAKTEAGVHVGEHNIPQHEGPHEGTTGAFLQKKSN